MIIPCYYHFIIMNYSNSKTNKKIFLFPIFCFAFMLDTFLSAKIFLNMLHLTFSKFNKSYIIELLLNNLHRNTIVAITNTFHQNNISEFISYQILFSNWTVFQMEKLIANLIMTAVFKRACKNWLILLKKNFLDLMLISLIYI
jgi:hypothetical protein